MRRFTPVAGLMCAALLLVAPLAFAQVVNTDLELIGNAVGSSANAINNAGDVVGFSAYTSAPLNRAAVWRNQIGVDLDLGCPSCQSVANDINDAGEIVGGRYSTFPGDGIAFIHTSNGTTLLPPLPGDTGAVARSINNLGVVVGQSVGPAGSRPVRWINGVPENLGVLGSVPQSFGVAESINDNGVIVGQSSTSTGFNRAFRWENGSMISLGTLPSSGTCVAVSSANGINELGAIVGVSTAGTSFPNCFSKPFLWVNGVMEQLPSGPFGTAIDINESGDIVGNSGASGQQVATLWREGEAIPLGVLNGFAQSIAGDISDVGVIAARSFSFINGNTNGRAHIFSVAPVNTPPSLDLPGDIVVNADAPGGATVFFTATAGDAEDGTFNAVCTPPGGSLFAIGPTTVSCTATDSGGLEASGTFDITVLGAYEQGLGMVATLGTSGPGGSLQQKLNAIIALLQSPGRGAQLCGKLQAFINDVSAQSGKKLTAAPAAELIASANRIRAIVGCN